MIWGTNWGAGTGVLFGGAPGVGPFKAAGWLAHPHTGVVGAGAVFCWQTYGVAPGGTGAAKTGGNYAAAFAGQQQALDNGCDQVVWLDAVEHSQVEEMGGMNLFFVYGSGADARIMTPALDVWSPTFSFTLWLQKRE